MLYEVITAVHRIPDVDSLIQNSVMCVMLRGALLPSMILSKEIQEYSADDFVTPFRITSYNVCYTKLLRYPLLHIPVD